MSETQTVPLRDVVAAMCDMQTGLQNLFHMLRAKPAFQGLNEPQRSMAARSHADQIRGAIAVHKQRLGICSQILTTFPAVND